PHGHENPPVRRGIQRIHPSRRHEDLAWHTVVKLTVLWLDIYHHQSSGSISKVKLFAVAAPNNSWNASLDTIVRNLPPPSRARERNHVDFTASAIVGNVSQPM